MTAAEVNRLSTGNHRVGGVAGLVLQVNKSGQGRSFTLRYTDAAGKRREVGIGSAHEITLQQARDKALELRRSMRLEGADPIRVKEERKLQALAQAQAAVTFADAVTGYLKDRDGTNGNLKHITQWQTTLDRYAVPFLGGLPVEAIMVDHVAEALRPVWTTKHETASRVRQRIEAVIAWADVKAKRARPNPARWQSNLDKLLPKVSRTVVGHAALPWKDAPSFMARLRQQGGQGARALEFAILTAARSGEVRGAPWSEIQGDTWVIPAERMKAKREHQVPLTPAALACLGERGADADLIFPGQKGQPLSDMALLAVLKRMGVQATTHGFRSTFKDWAAEATDYPNEVSEMALAHAVGDKVEAAYRRGNLLQKRVGIMRDWAAHLGV
jgi:integrase